MGVFDELYNGAVDIASGVADTVEGATNFVVDVVGATQELASGNPREAAAQIFGSVQEDLLGKSMQGLFGPEGVGGTLIGALPEFIREPGREVVDPVFGAWGWAIDEIVDRPLGTYFTVLNAANPLMGGSVSALFNIDTYERAWAINDKRTFGQSVTAALYRIDPFDAAEYNAIQDDPIFDLLSGTLDFAQEFLDPVVLLGGGAIKTVRGSTVIAGMPNRIRAGRILAAPQEATRVIGGGTGIRPNKILGSEIPFLTKNSAQKTKQQNILQNVRQQRSDAFVNSDSWLNLENAMSKAGDDVLKRSAALRAAIGTRSRQLPDEAVTLISNGGTAEARRLTMRALMGDLRVFDEVESLAQNLLNRMNAENWADVDAARKAIDAGQGLTVSPAARLEAIAFNETAAAVDWSVMDAFRSDLFQSQQRKLHFENGIMQKSNDYNMTLNSMDSNTMRLSIETLLGDNKAIYGFGTVSKAPFGTRLNMLLNKHNEVLAKSGDEFVVTELINPHTVGAKLGGHKGKLTRLVTERLPQTMIFFKEASAVRQFERVLTQATRVNHKGKTITTADEATQVLAEFQRLKVANDFTGMQGLYYETVQAFNKRLDDLIEESGIVGVNKDARLLTQSYNEMEDVAKQAISRSQGVTDEAGKLNGSLVKLEFDDGSVVNTHYRVTPSQLQASHVQPRYDIVQRQIELAEARGSGKLSVKAGDLSRKALTKGRIGFDGPQQAWRQMILLTPKWPMRVGLDEQLRMGAVLGGMTMMGNLLSAIPEMRRAFAVHNLDGFDDVADITALTNKLRSQSGVVSRQDQIIDISKQLDEQLAEYGRVSNMPPEIAQLRTQLIQERRRLKTGSTDISAPVEFADDTDFLALYEAVGEEGFKKAVKEVVREKVLRVRENRNRLGRNAAYKGLGVGLVMGNPLAGAIYGFAAYGSKRRRINQAGTRAAGLNYAAQLRREGELLLQRAAGNADEVAAGRALMDDAAYIKKLIDDEAVGAAEARNAFDAADELMDAAGVPSLQIGNVTFRNAFGDDPRYQEQIRAQVSASNQLSTVFRGSRRNAERQLARYQNQNWRRWDILDDSKAADFGDRFGDMMNLYTTNATDSAFYRLAWSNEDIAVRYEKMTDLLTNNEKVWNDLMSPRRLVEFEPEQIRGLAKAIVDEYENVLPSTYFSGLRKRASTGTVDWTEVQSVIKRVSDEGEDLNAFVTRLREEGYEGFGKSIGPEPASFNSYNRVGFNEATKGFTERLFTLFGSLPSDELARNPFFRTVYERELTRRVQPMLDADGNVRMSQRAINDMENQAREAAMQETKRVLYDLAEETRLGEMVGSAMPFFNAWQEVLGRWSGFMVQNPTYTANMFRLYQKPWNAEALGISEVKVDDGKGGESTFLMFRPFGPAYDEEGNETTIFEALSPKMRELLIPEAVRDGNAPIRFSKDGLNTMIQGSMPGVGPLITIPVGAATLAEPELERTFGFMFPFGHPEGGLLDRTVKANLPTWSKSVIDIVQGPDSPTTKRIVQRMFVDIITERQAGGAPLDWNDDQEVLAAIEEANDRAQNFNMFRVAAGLFSPTSTTVLSPFHNLIEEARKLRQEHGSKIGHSMFLDKYGEDFFALTARMTRLNDGVAASLKSEELYIKHQDLVQAHPEVGAWITASVGDSSETFMFSQAAYRRQTIMELAPGSEENRRERKTPLETVGDTQAELGWLAYSRLNDFVRMHQDKSEAAGLSRSLNASHLQGVRQFKSEEVQKLRKKYPDWAQQFDDFGSSDRRMADVVDGFAAGLADEALLQRPSTEHVLNYFRLRNFVQRQLMGRKTAGGSDDIGAKSNEDLQLFWDEERYVLGSNPAFAGIWDRFFENDKLRKATFADLDAFEGILL